MAKKIYIGNMIQDLQSSIADLQTDIGTMSTDIGNMVSQLLEIGANTGQSISVLKVKESAVNAISFNWGYASIICNCEGSINFRIPDVITFTPKQNQASGAWRIHINITLNGVTSYLDSDPYNGALVNGTPIEFSFATTIKKLIVANGDSISVVLEKSANAGVKSPALTVFDAPDFDTYLDYELRSMTVDGAFETV